ncbi:MAG: ATP-binding cassette domain-containing protein [Ancrocorticia sp.]
MGKRVASSERVVPGGEVSSAGRSVLAGDAVIGGDAMADGQTVVSGQVATGAQSVPTGEAESAGETVPVRGAVSVEQDHEQAHLKVENLTVSYDGKPVLAGVDLDIEPGTLHVLLGPSGAGKSTLIHALTGTLPRSATVSGAIDLLCGTKRWDLTTLSARAFRSQVLGRIIGTTTQGSVTAFSATSKIGTQLREVLRASTRGPRLLPSHPHLTSADREQHLRELCWTCGGEPEWLGRYPHQLSGGQLSRLGLVAAMVGHPPILLADEPTTGLDPESADTIVKTLASFAHSGHAVLLITHDAELARRYGDVVTVLTDGAVTAHGDPRALLPSARRSHRSFATVPVTPETQLSACRVTRILGGYEIIRDLSLEIPRGHIVGLSGPSGVGKSTMASMMALLEAPDEGNVELDGQVLADAGLALAPAVRRRVGWVSQQPFTAMDPRMTLAQAIELPARLAGLNIRGEEAAAWCGLPAELLRRHPHQVSGGELQRACIARALALQPDYLVLDEITTMLDEDTASGVLAWIRDTVHERGIGALLISHDQFMLNEFADSHLRLEPGSEGPELHPTEPTA